MQNPSTHSLQASTRPLSEPISLGLISNPLAKSNWRASLHRSLCPSLPPHTPAIETPSLDALQAAVERLLHQEKVNVLIINGGDGTIHHVLNAVISSCLNAPSPSPLPYFLFVNGGGMNMLARVFKAKKDPLWSLKRFLRLYEHAKIGELATKRVSLLKVETEERGAHYGYIFGSSLVHNALYMYEKFGEGYLGLGRLLYQASKGYAFKTELWKQYGHLLTPPSTPLLIQTPSGTRQSIEDYSAFVASTVPLQLAKGLISPFDHQNSYQELSSLIMSGSNERDLILSLPSFLLGKLPENVQLSKEQRRFELFGSYTLDGERFDRHELSLNPEYAEKAPLSVELSEISIDGVFL